MLLNSIYILRKLKCTICSNNLFKKKSRNFYNPLMVLPSSKCQHISLNIFSLKDISCMFKHKLRINRNRKIFRCKRIHHLRIVSPLEQKIKDSLITRGINRVKFTSSWQLWPRRRLRSGVHPHAQKCERVAKRHAKENRDKRQSVNVRQLQFATCVSHIARTFLRSNCCSNCSNEQRDKNRHFRRSCSELTTSRSLIVNRRCSARFSTTKKPATGPFNREERRSRRRL